MRDLVAPFFYRRFIAVRYSMTDSETPQPRSLWRRCNNAINNNPVGTFALLTAAVAAFFWGNLHDAMGNLNSAASRIDRLATDMGEMKGTLTHVSSQVDKIDGMNMTLGQLRDFNSVIDQQLRSLKSYEVHIIESFGVKADENLIVRVQGGVVVAYPLTDQKKTELIRAKFTETNSFLNEPVSAQGFALPTESRFIPTPPPRRR